METEDDIRQRDLSGKTVREMDEQEKLEIKRRFDEFVELVKTRKVRVQTPARPRQVTKWNPLAQGAKRV
ncbi:hypothetical protein SAMN06265365_101145 [Tistlia consotensis]|uniref:Uncharacterized protein n=1 Tax=Tistlia consotensis USBA 355 TaxID=560819 RepID=A0A1Y6B782_9PROT|nr:hypothetical protein [Tistlia consotensis]SME88833.1 hypothetical protein SAMN05428998_101145 [Tistlia consotensis USBA 355]SNR25382.1 hypothetical protein SAMN06265365_101145 [Tistlia consotensis]